MRKKKNNKGNIIIVVLIIVIFVLVGISFKSSRTSLTANNKLYDVTKLKIKNLEDYSIFKDISNNVNTIETIYIGNKYYANLDLSGKVVLSINNNDEWTNGTLDIDNVVDIIHFSIPAMEEEQLLYLLTSDGSVYWYKFGDSSNNQFKVTKDKSVSNVEQLFISTYTKKNAGSSWALYAITNKNECIMLKASSV